MYRYSLFFHVIIDKSGNEVILMKKILTIFICIILFAGYIIGVSSNGNRRVVYDDFVVGAQLPEDHVFTTTDQEGNVVELDVEAMEEKVKEEKQEQERIASSSQGGIGGTTNIVNGVVNFKTKTSAEYNTLYSEDESGRSGYLNGYYASDGAFLGYNSEGTKVKFMQSGVVGWVDANEVEILDYDDENVVKSINYYHVKNGKLYHYGTTDIKSPYYSMCNLIGYKQSYMSENAIYYSYDGHYFYQTYAQMIEDYKNDCRTHSINPNQPYYNYYQYLSHRSTTNLTAEMLDAFVASKVGSTDSKMSAMGQYFIQYQNEYGSNALLMFGVAANESLWGTSSIAQEKNNLFGHAAYDSSAGDSANGYVSPQMSIYSHARYFISEGYLDPLDYTGRYYGSHLGDKASGINVKYASDPYWGEKAAEICWLVYDANSSTNDRNKYTIGMKEGNYSLNIRQEPTSSSNSLYRSGTARHYPFLILKEVNGENVSGNTKWYQIQSDPTLKSDRSAITQDNGVYDFNKFYAYVSAAYISIVQETDHQDPSTTYLKGDVNGDGYISSKDYNAIKNHITGSKPLSGDTLRRADVNEDGYISSKDYNAIKNHITGNKKLF